MSPAHLSSFFVYLLFLQSNRKELFIQKFLVALFVWIVTPQFKVTSLNAPVVSKFGRIFGWIYLLALPLSESEGNGSKGETSSFPSQKGWAAILPNACKPQNFLGFYHFKQTFTSKFCGVEWRSLGFLLGLRNLPRYLPGKALIIR